MKNYVYMKFEGLPPTTNAAYFDMVKTVPKGKTKKFTVIRVLTTEGKKYKKEISVAVAQKYSPFTLWIQKNKPYVLTVRLHTSQLYNSGYPTKAESLFKKFDVTNRVKLLEDALVDALAIDDSQFLRVIIEKQEDQTDFLEVWVEDY